MPGGRLPVTVPVYRFEYLDRSTGTTAISTHFATEAAIRQLGALALRETERHVDEGIISFAGLVPEAAMLEWEQRRLVKDSG